MRILFVHNAYQQRGGEDAVVEAEIALMRSAGHAVDALIVSNDTIAGLTAQARAAVNAIYSRWGYTQVADAIKAFEPDVVHVHNFFPLLSPSVFDACHDLGVPSVWTLHNYRVSCANGFLLRDGRPCEDCLGSMPIPAIVHRCYRGSTIGSASVAAMIGYHRLAKTWTTKVTRFLVLTDFAREIAIKAGLPSDRIVVKPNFVPAPAAPGPPWPERDGFVFVGRLSVEKGVRILLDAWQDLPFPLTIVGDGPLAAEVKAAADQNPVIRYLGQQPNSLVQEMIRQSKAIIIPSIWYENQPLTLIEALANGTPIIASHVGALSGLVAPERTGFLFELGQLLSLSEVVLKYSRTGSRRFPEMTQLCTAEYNRLYSQEVAETQSLKIYSEAGAERSEGLMA